MSELVRIPRLGRLNKARRKTTRRSIREFPRHGLESYVVSPKLGTCASAAEYARDLGESFSAQYATTDPSLPPRRRVIDSMTILFHRVYTDGVIWYPRDRWRTAWSLTIRAAKRNDTVSKDQIHALYENVRYLRNPSSDQEAVK